MLHGLFKTKSTKTTTMLRLYVNIHVLCEMQKCSNDKTGAANVTTDNQ